MLDTKQLGKRIALLRKQSGMSQEKLAELLCISPQAISKWENGHTTPETSLLPVLAQIFQCSTDEIIMPAYLFEGEIEEKKPNRMDWQARQIADYIIQQIGGATTGETIGLCDAEIIEAVRRVHPNLENFQIARGKPEVHERYVSIYIMVTASQQKLRLVEKIYHGEDRELLGYELFSRYVTAAPQVYCVDFDKRILLVVEVIDSIQGNIFVSKPPSASVKLIDMEAVRVGLCTEDLAMLLALHIEPDRERAKPLLDHYYESLCRNVKGYSREMFMEDYRIAVAEAMFYPVRLINCGIYDFVMRDRAIRAYEAYR